MVIHIPLIQKLWIILSLVNKAKVATSNGIDFLRMINMGTLQLIIVSRDGLTYTYKIRKGVNGSLLMVKSTQGTAKDFCKWLKHAAESAAMYLAEIQLKV